MYAIFVLFLFPSSLLFAATYYVDGTVINDSGNGSVSQPKKYIKSGISLLASGDTLIIKDGVYTGINNMMCNNSNWEWTNGIPDGTAANYTTIKAENYLGAVLDGEDLYVPIYVDQLSYVRFENLHIRNGGGATVASNVVITYSDHIKIIKCASEETYNWHFRLTNCKYSLFEDCFTWGRGAYAFVAKADGGYTNCQYNVYRRCVARRDAHYWYIGGNNHGSFVSYASDSNYYQNCISIDHRYVYAGDPNPPGFSIGSFYIANGGSNYSVNGSLAVNEENNGCFFEEGPTNVTLNNLVVIMASNSARAFWGRDSSTINIQNSIFSGSASDGIYESGTTNLQSCKNNIIFNNAAGFNNVDGSHTYNVLYDNTSGDFVGSTGPNTGEVTNRNPLTSGLLFPLRIEASSYLKTAGESGGQVGPTILNKIGVDGTLYGETGWNSDTGNPLWPFPNEDKIQEKMRVYNLHGVDGARGFCADGQTLTKYIWQYLGNIIPADMYGLNITTDSIERSDGSGGDGGGCFIATASYDSPISNEVIILREFRTKKLLTNTYGHNFVQFYYKYSPPIASYIAKRRYVKYIIRGILKPIVWYARKVLSK
ncbi:MAG: hypothetical protein KA807_07150 [Prolixibacteraceae bacterium]|nr:hypothetical protein [Prolixibacteraceae bacterium]